MPRLLALTATVLAVTSPLGAQSIRDVAAARDGRLAASIDGDLWVRGTGTDSTWRRVTSGPAWDREPAWSADGRWLVFTSDRAGSFDVWRVRPGDDPRAASDAERLTSDPATESMPTVAPDGSIAFVRGDAPATRLIVRADDGSESAPPWSGDGVRAVAYSPDGSRLAYVRARDGRSELRVRTLAGGADSLVAAGSWIDRPAWAPDGVRLAYTTTGARSGTMVASRDGRWSTLASERVAIAAWSPDGRTLTLAPIANASSSYNGDPDRLRDHARERAERLDAMPMLVTVDAPTLPDANARTERPVLALDRAARNAEAFDRAWGRSEALYFAEPGARRDAWRRLRDVHRARAIAAPDDSALAAALFALHRARPPLRDVATGRAAVSSAHPRATAAGVEILRRGGNVVDAAVAVSFMLGVVEPDASGIGGYGQMLVRLAGREQPVLIDFMSRAPEAATLDNPAFRATGYPTDGPMLANVPGTVAGMHRAWQRFGSGRIAWADLVAPAIAAARDGYVVSDGLATTLAVEQDAFRRYAASRALFFRDDRPLRAGDTLRNPELAWTLEQVAARGADGFYQGEVARRMVADLRAGGNVMTALDVSRYHAVEREPVQGTYRGHTVVSSAPPVAGGATLVSQLQLRALGPVGGAYRDDAASLHALISAWLLVPGARGRIADPGLWPVNVTAYTSVDSARTRWRCFTAARALAPSDLRGELPACAAPDTTRTPSPPPTPAESRRSTGTTAFTVADAAGNVVAVTQTLGTWGGTFHVTPGLGFLYNDKLTSYPLDPGAYGARLPNARHGSSLAPTIVLRGTGRDARPVLAIGAAGNAWITSAVLAGVIGVIDEGLDAQRALELPRFLPTGRGLATLGAAARIELDVEDGFAPGSIACAHSATACARSPSPASCAWATAPRSPSVAAASPPAPTRGVRVPPAPCRRLVRCREQRDGRQGTAEHGSDEQDGDCTQTCDSIVTQPFCCSLHVAALHCSSPAVHALGPSGGRPRSRQQPPHRTSTVSPRSFTPRDASHTPTLARRIAYSGRSAIDGVASGKASAAA